MKEAPLIDKLLKLGWVMTVTPDRKKADKTTLSITKQVATKDYFFNLAKNDAKHD
jgi:hypothetical protein